MFLSRSKGPQVSDGGDDVDKSSRTRSVKPSPQAATPEPQRATIEEPERGILP